MYDQGTLFDAIGQGKTEVAIDESIPKTDLAYMGGIIDGEGCVRMFSRPMGEGYINYKCITTVINTDKRLIDWIKARFKIGRIEFRNYPSQRNCKPVWVWILRVEEMKAFLPTIIPYLLIKQWHAKMILKMLARSKAARRCDKITSEENEQRKELFDNFVSRGYSKSECFACNDGHLRNSYLAGLFDGEGCFSMKSYKKKRVTGYCLDGGITNTCRDMVEWAKGATGLGTVYCSPRSRVSNKHSDCHFWRLSAPEILAFSQMIRPYVLLKGDRIDVVCKYLGEHGRLLSKMKAIKKQLEIDLGNLNKRGREPCQPCAEESVNG